jgi:hypothetical protein
MKNVKKLKKKRREGITTLRETPKFAEVISPVVGNSFDPVWYTQNEVVNDNLV